jgi:hypothetical protein
VDSSDRHAVLPFLIATTPRALADKSLMQSLMHIGGEKDDY